MTDTSRTARQSRLRRHLTLIDTGIRPVTETYASSIQCKRGCSNCCSQKFAVSELEGELLGEGLNSAETETRVDIRRRASTHRPGDPCPVLSADGACRLYDFRPRICRKYGIPLWNPNDPGRVKTCELNFQDLVDLDPALIVDPQAKWAMDWIELRKELSLNKQDNRSIAEWLMSALPD